MILLLRRFLNFTSHGIRQCIQRQQLAVPVRTSIIALQPKPRTATAPLRPTDHTWASNQIKVRRNHFFFRKKSSAKKRRGGKGKGAQETTAGRPSTPHVVTSSSFLFPRWERKRDKEFRSKSPRISHLLAFGHQCRQIPAEFWCSPVSRGRCDARCPLGMNDVLRRVVTRKNHSLLNFSPGFLRMRPICDDSDDSTRTMANPRRLGNFPSLRVRAGQRRAQVDS